MCGIFGVVGHIEPSRARACLDRLAHRGPDGSGLWNGPGVTLGHRRLSIIDPSPLGAQPMHDAGRRYTITYNGEIYNFLELRAQLAAHGHRFASESDTEVILAAFREWGEDCQQRFNGMWAFAIWDSLERRLFLSRDRFGKKPLFYASTPSGFAFASEMKALIPLLAEARANRRVICDPTQMFRYEAGSECLVEQVQRMPAGHCGWTAGERPQLRRWWCTLDHLSEPPQSYPEQVERMRELFLDACRLRMRSDVPIGTALSGGLDSSATIASMAHVARAGGNHVGPRWQHAFVAVFPGTPLDESEWARRVTEHLRIPITTVEIDPKAALDRLAGELYRFEETYITSPVPFMATYRAVREAGVRVTLDGHGADELFAGYGFDYLTALRDAGLDLPRALAVVDAYLASWPRASAQFAALPSRWRFLVEWHLRRLVRLALRRNAQPPARDRDHPAFLRLDHLGQQLYVSTHDTVLPTLLRNYDRYSMANGVEIRMPFMDHRIVTFAFSLAWNAKVRDGYSKAVVRDAVAPLLPEEVVRRRSKIGFNSPVVDWMKGPWRQFMLDVLADRSFRECDLIDTAQTDAAVRKVLDDPLARFSDGERAWTLLSPWLWERFVLQPASARLESVV